jgi:hypothetical protein
MATIRNLAINLFPWFKIDEPEAFLKELYRFQRLKSLVIVLKPHWGGPIHYNRPFVDPTHGRRKEVHSIMDEIDDIFMNARRTYPEWNPPDLKVVFLEGDE